MEFEPVKLNVPTGMWTTLTVPCYHVQCIVDTKRKDIKFPNKLNYRPMTGEFIYPVGCKNLRDKPFLIKSIAHYSYEKGSSLILQLEEIK